ncbi:MAG: ribosome silencing factor [Deltaproteobacteria bacterium]|nr:ribosome silencing factor [Deltaproteobacteria bacterium]
MAAEAVENPQVAKPEVEQFALVLAQEALDKKALEPVLLDATGLSAYADYFLLLSASNERQVSALADSLERKAKKEGHRPLGTEGATGSRWVLIDLGEVVVHVFHEEARYHYDLDGLWADARRVSIPGAPPRPAF